MNPVKAAANWLARLTTPKAAKRRGSYEAARLTRYIDFSSALEAAHKERCRDLTALRAHSRELAKNNAYMQAYIDLIADNIIGPDGIDLENNLLDAKGEARETENDIVEAAWEDWGRRVTADGRLGWLDFQHLAAKSLAIDGEIFVHLLRGHGPHGLLLELIDPDRVDHRLNTPFQNGRRIVMGIEVDALFKPIAYHIRTAHPNDPQGMPQLTRVPADQIIHVYTDDRTASVRGIPWVTSCMVQLSMLDRLWKSTLATANAEADRVGVIKGASNLPIDDIDKLREREETGEGETTLSVAKDLTTNILTFMGIPPGMDVDFPPPNHPNGVLADFTKFLLKGIASAMRVSYHALSGDVAEANYSSLRASLLPEKDAWRTKQASLINRLHEPLFHAWYQMAWISHTLPPNMPPDEFARPKWWPRSWDWVDPVKDIRADIDALDNCLTTLQEIYGKRGLDWREQLRQIAAEDKYAREQGITLPRVIKQLQAYGKPH